MTGERYSEIGSSKYRKYFLWLYVLSPVVQELCSLQPSKITWFGQCSDPILLEFSQFLKVGV